MGIQLGSASVSDPAIKTLDVGDKVIFHLVNAEQKPAYDLETGDRKMSKKGNPLDQMKLTVKLIKAEGTGIAAGTKKEPADITPGEIYTIWSGVSGLFEWRDGVQDFLKKHGRQVEVGDVFCWSLDREDEPKQRGWNGQKHRSFAGRPPKAEEAAEVAACEALYVERKQGVALTDEAPEGVQYDNDDEMPF